MRAKAGILALTGLFLLICGWRPTELPFIPGAVFSDAAVAHYPSALHLYQTVRSSDRSLLWWELNMAGQPFAANPLNKTAYPPQWLAFLLPPTLHLNCLIFAHFAIAALGMWQWTRTIGLSEMAALTAALAYGLSPRLAAHTGAGHLDLLYAMAWFPWLMWGVRSWCTRAPSIRTGLALLLTAALIFLADVRLSLFAFMAGALYGLVLIGSRRKWREILRTLILLPPWTLLAAPVIIPLVLWQPYLSRANLTTAEVGAFSLQPIYLAGLVIAPQPTIDQEMLTYCGLSVLVLAVGAVIGQPSRLAGWVLLVAFAVWYALGAYGSLWQTLIDVLPILRWFRVPARAWLIAALVIPLLAGCGVHTLTQRFKLRLLPVALAGIVFLDLTIFGTRWLEWRSEADWLSPYMPLAQLLLNEKADRVYSPAYSLPQQTAAVFGLSLLGGVDPFQLSGVNAAIAQGSGVDSPGYSVVQPPLVGGTGDNLSTVNRDAVPDTQTLAAWQVSHVIAPYSITHSRLREIGLTNSVHVYRNLDYQLTLLQDQVPRWPDEWPGLPDVHTVAALNSWTGVSALAGALMLVLLCVFTLIRVIPKR
jgi:hypothetical protein